MMALKLNQRNGNLEDASHQDSAILATGAFERAPQEPAINVSGQTPLSEVCFTGLSSSALQVPNRNDQNSPHAASLLKRTATQLLSGLAPGHLFLALGNRVERVSGVPCHSTRQLFRNSSDFAASRGTYPQFGGQCQPIKDGKQLPVLRRKYV